MNQHLLLLISTILCIASISRTRGTGGYWLLDPRGATSVLIYLHASGYLLYATINDSILPTFGLEPDFIEYGNALLVSAQAGFFVGSFLGTGWLAQALPALHLDERSERWFLSTLTAAVFLTALPMIYTFVDDWGNLAAARYGADRGETDLATKYALFSNVSLVAIPTLLLLLIALGSTGRPIDTGWTRTLAAMCITPTLLAGGRKDVFIVLASFFLAWSMRQLKRPWKAAVVFALALAFLSTVITKSRSGATLAIEDRIDAIQSEQEGNIIDQLCLMYAGLPSITATMSIFPTVVPHTLGRSYAQALVNVSSPAFVTGRYPYTPMAHQFRELYYPDVRGFGFDYAMAAEAWQNFGAVGPFIVFALVSFLLSCLYSLGRARERANPWLLLYVAVLVSSLYGLRTDSNGLFKTIIYTSLWVIGLLFLSRTLAIFFTRRRMSGDAASPRNGRGAAIDSARHVA